MLDLGFNSILLRLAAGQNLFLEFDKFFAITRKVAPKLHQKCRCL
jgi:hypothetical protein